MSNITNLLSIKYIAVMYMWHKRYLARFEKSVNRKNLQIERRWTVFFSRLHKTAHIILTPEVTRSFKVVNIISLIVTLELPFW